MPKANVFLQKISWRRWCAHSAEQALLCSSASLWRQSLFCAFYIKNRQYNCNIKLINENEFKTLDGNGNWKKNLNEFETAKNRKSFHFSRFERRNNQASIKSPIIHFIAHIIHFNSISNKTVDPSLLLLKPLEICFSSIWWTVLNFRPANIQTSPPNRSKV